jgi:hypothetical protein
MCMKMNLLTSFKKNSKAKKATSETEAEWLNLSQNYKLVSDSCNWSFCDKQSANVNKCMVEKANCINIICIDEGVQYYGANNKTIQIAIPGSGILMNNSMEEIIEKVCVLIERNPINTINITSHTNCGAACLATRNKCKQLSGSRLELFADRISDKVGQVYVNILTNKIRHATSAKVNTSQIHIQEIDRPKFHHAFGAVINFVPYFNVGLFEQEIGLPMFGISAFMIEEDEILEEICLSYNIASGDHGFKNMFTAEKPFEVISVIRREEDALRIQSIFNKMVQKFDSIMPVAYSIVKLEH